jgi:hypothetical protein
MLRICSTGVISIRQCAAKLSRSVDVTAEMIV